MKEPSRRGVKMYETFNGYQPKKLAVGADLPKSVVLAGDALEVLYRSGKLDPVSRRKPKRAIDYIHDHDAGVKVYRTDLEDGRATRVPNFIAESRELVFLGQCLGFAYRDGEGQEIEAQVKTPYPDLYTIPSGRALVVVQGKRDVLAIMWGGKLGVEWRGIVH